MEFLESLSVEQYYRLGKPAVRILYLDEAGEEVLLVRSRVSLTGKPKILTRKGDKHRLYGLWKLEDARKAGYVWAVEGESDPQTLWYHKEPAVGIPGANGWKTEWASDLHGIGTIYVVVEDEAGEALWRKMAASPELRERLYRVELEGVKDVSELHKSDPEAFHRRLSAALEGARAWPDIAGLDTGRNSKSSQETTPFTPPTPILEDLPEVPAFPVDALPIITRRFVGEAADAIGCPPELIAVPLLATLSAGIGASRVVELKRGGGNPRHCIWP